MLFETKTVGIDNPAGLPLIRVRWQLDNHLGSSSTELDNSAQVISYEEYHPFGSTSFHTVNGGAEVSAKRYRYTGKERDDETGLYYYGARYYAAWLGRWTGCDPKMGTAGNNLFIYCSNNPVGRVDPDGGEDKAAAGTVPPAPTRYDIIPQIPLVKYDKGILNPLAVVENSLRNVVNQVTGTVNQLVTEVAYIGQHGIVNYSKQAVESYKQMGSSIKESAVNTWNYHTETPIKQQASDALCSLQDPQQWEASVTIAADLLIGKGMGKLAKVPAHPKPNISKPTKVTPKTKPTSGTGVNIDVDVKKINVDANTTKSVPAYRVQGGILPNASKNRIVFNNGQPSIIGDDMLFINVNQKSRALEFLAKRGGGC